MFGCGRRRISKIHYSASNCRTTLNFALIESSWTRLSFETKFMKISWLRELEINFQNERCALLLSCGEKAEAGKVSPPVGTRHRHPLRANLRAECWRGMSDSHLGAARDKNSESISTHLHNRLVDTFTCSTTPNSSAIYPFEWNSAKLDGILVSFGKLKHPAECGIQSGAGGIEWSVKTGGRCWVPSIQRSEVGVPLMALVTWCCSRSERFQTCPAGVVNRRPFGCCDIK